MLSQNGAPPLIFESVSKTFFTQKRAMLAVDGFDARLPANRVTGLVGPDGAGKTTLLRLATGLLLPDAGRVAALGHDVNRDPLAVQEAVGYMPQRFGLYEDLTVQENLDLYADLQGVTPSDRKARYEDLMQMTKLGRFTRRMTRALSGGMKQKLGLACALVRSPQLLLLDEPTVGVDPVSRRELWEIVYRLVREEGLTVLLSTAYLDEAERCDQVLLMHQGRLLGQGPPDEFSAEVTGRSFQARAPELNKRTLQTRLRDAGGVMDAVIHAGGVRVVTETDRPPDMGELFPDHPEAAIERVPARFEDSFIARLRKQENGGLPPTRIDTGKRISGDASGQDVIAVKDLKRRFGDFLAVKGISFSVRRGEVFGLLGPNGAGKSTTFRMLCGLLPASGGSLHVAGRDLRRAPAAARAHIGYMAQRFSLYSDLSVMENLKFFSAAYGLYGRQQRQQMQWAMTEFELTGFAGATSRDLPLGFKQRLALAAALMHRPDILFLDEPTSGVDPLARREFWQRISALSAQGVTVLVTTHFMEEAEHCDRLVMMSEGDILSQGAPEALKDRFRTEDNPEPSMEDVFIGWVKVQEGAAA